MGTRKHFTPEFKREAVQLLESGSRPGSEIARELGIARNQLDKWQTELRARGSGAFPGSGARKARTTEIARLKRGLARVTEERAILKKAAGEAYGTRKMWQLLNLEGVVCGRHRVARLRRLAGIMALRRQRSIRTMQARHQEASIIPNRLNQQFTVSPKNQVWAADCTFVPTRAGWLSVAVVLDLYSRRIVGGAMSPRQTLTVGAEAWWMAWQRRRPAPGLIPHSDQGNQYRASLYQRLLARRGVVSSMSRNDRN